MHARRYLLAATALGAALIAAPSLGFVAYSAGYQAGAEASTVLPVGAQLQPPAATVTGLCSIPNISAVCSTDPGPAPRMPTTPLRPVATSGLCAIPNISNLCPVR